MSDQVGNLVDWFSRVVAYMSRVKRKSVKAINQVLKSTGQYILRTQKLEISNFKRREIGEAKPKTLISCAVDYCCSVINLSK